MRKLISWRLLTGITLAALAGCGGGGFFPDNNEPKITDLFANGADNQPITVTPGSTVALSVDAQDDDPLTYHWTASRNSSGISNPVTDANWLATWTAPADEGVATITVTVSDDRGGSTTKSVEVAVVNGAANHAPTVTLAPATVTLKKGQTATFQATADDQDPGDKASLTYAFFNSTGKLPNQAADKTKADYTAPMNPGADVVYVIVTDPKGLTALATAKVTVTD